MEDSALEELGRIIPNVCRGARLTYKICKDLRPGEQELCKGQRELLELCYKNRGTQFEGRSRG